MRSIGASLCMPSTSLWNNYIIIIRVVFRILILSWGISVIFVFVFISASICDYFSPSASTSQKYALGVVKTNREHGRYSVEHTELT